MDLAGFSTSVHGKSPASIAAYLKPFLQSTIAILRGRSALVDKTIGDEVMFVLPESEEERNPPEILLLGQIMGTLHDLAFELGDQYAFRIGLSYGTLRYFKIEAEGYSEWTSVGEPVHIAKRLHSLPDLAKPQPVSGAFGMHFSPESERDVRETMEQRLSIIAGFVSRFDHRLVDQPVELKGVGQVLHAILVPPPEPAGAVRDRME